MANLMNVELDGKGGGWWCEIEPGNWVSCDSLVEARDLAELHGFDGISYE